MMLSYITAALLPALASAVAWGGPEPTAPVETDSAIYGWSPAPTKAPFLQHAVPGLLKRQDVTETCGWVKGDFSSAVYCNNGMQCATDALYSVYGCCDPTDLYCTIPVACLASTELAYFCDEECMTNDYIVKCTNPAEGYECFTDLFSDGITGYGCGPASTILMVEPTYSGQIESTDERSFAVVSAPSTGNGQLSSIRSIATSASRASSVSSSPVPASKKKTSIAPIVGGVIGGLIVLGALIGAVLFFLNRKKRRANEAASRPHNLTQGGGSAVVDAKPFTSSSQQPQAGTVTYYPPGKQDTMISAQPASPMMSSQATGMQQPPMRQSVMVEQHPYSPPVSPPPQYVQPMPMAPQQMTAPQFQAQLQQAYPQPPPPQQGPMQPQPQSPMVAPQSTGMSTQTQQMPSNAAQLDGQAVYPSRHGVHEVA